MPENLDSKKLERIKMIMVDIDEIIAVKQYEIIDVLNAVSMFSVSLAVNFDLDKETYLRDLSIMFDQKRNALAK
jgi:hypothetical protein